MANYPAPPENGNGGGSLGFLQGMVTFFDKNFGNFSKLAQNVTVIVFLFIFASVALNTFLAPTFIEGKLYLFDETKPNPRRVPAYNYRVAIGEHVDTIQRGVKRNWRLPLYSGIPHTYTITVEPPPYEPDDPDDVSYSENEEDEEAGIVGVVYITAPIPIYSALIRPEYDIIIHKKSNEKVEVYIEIAFNTTDHSMGDLEISPGRILKSASAYMIPLHRRKDQYVPREKPMRKATEAFIKAGHLPPEEKFAIPAYLLELQSIKADDLKSFIFSSKNVAFRIKMDGRLMSYKKLLGGNRVIFRSERFSWVYRVEDQLDPVQAPVGFPVPEISSTWIPVSEGDTYRYGDLHANIISAVSFSTGINNQTAMLEVEPAGDRVTLEMTDGRGRNKEPLAHFDITDAITKPNIISSIISDDGSTTIDVKFIPAWLVGFDLPPYISLSKCFENSASANELAKKIHEVDPNFLAEVFKTDDIRFCGREFRSKTHAYRVIISGADDYYRPSHLYGLLKQYFNDGDIPFAPVGFDYKSGSPATIYWDYGEDKTREK